MEGVFLEIGCKGLCSFIYMLSVNTFVSATNGHLFLFGYSFTLCTAAQNRHFIRVVSAPV